MRDGPEAKFLKYGFIAQDVEHLFPNLVRTDPDGYKAIVYQDFIALLTNAVQHLDTRVDALEQGVDQLQLERAAYREDVEMLKREHKAHREDVEMLQREHEVLKRKHNADIEALKRKLVAEIEALKME
eukprot:GEMP01024751.1.p2 GENE.GEMP01024751.1~~GEMP01024751.1.p2  ORF type:complete len:128 (+),score=48.24 GEMP01024751.1:1208-1591(+)